MTLFKALDLDCIESSCMYPGLLSRKRKYIYFFAEAQAYLWFQLLTTTKSDTWGCINRVVFQDSDGKIQNKFWGKKISKHRLNGFVLMCEG